MIGRLLAAVGAVAVVAGTSLWVAPPGGAVSPALAVHLQRLPDLVTPDGPASLPLVVRGTPPEGTSVRVSVYRAARDRTAIQSSFVKPPDDRPTTLTFDLAAIPGGVDGSPLVTFPTSVGRPPDRQTVRMAESGSYPTYVDVVGPDDEVLGTLATTLVRAPDAGDASRPLAVSLMLPVTSAPALQPDGTVVASDDEVARLASLADALSARPGVPLTVVPNPETISSFARTDGGAGVVGTLAGALEGRQVLSPAFSPIDAPSLIAAGGTGELVAQLAGGATALGTALDPARPDPRTWVAAGPVDSPTLDALRDLRVDRLVLPDVALRDGPVATDRVVEVDGGTSSFPRTAIIDAALSLRLSADRTPAELASDLRAELVRIWLDEPEAQRGVVIQAPAGWAPGTDRFVAVLDMLAQTPSLRPTTIDQLFDSVDRSTSDDGEPVVLRLAAPTLVDLGGEVRAVGDARARASSFADVVERTPAQRAATEQALLMGTTSALAPAGRTAFVGTVERSLDAIANGVEPFSADRYTLPARAGRIPITIRSTTDEPMTITLKLESDKLDFPEGNERNVELQRSLQVELVDVRVKAPGDFTVTVSYLTPDGRFALQPPGQLRLRSTAVSGVGVVISVGALGFLAAWWVRHLARGRRARAADPSGGA